MIDKFLENIRYFTKITEETITQNRVLSSIVGSTMDGKFYFSAIDMSWRDQGEDIDTRTLVENFKKSGEDEILVYVPGLFTDESLWKNKTIKVKDRNFLSRGIADYLDGRGYFPAFLRFNHGLHISENGQKFLKLMKELKSLLPDTKIHILSYSLGALVTRSMLYQAKSEKPEGVGKLGKIINLASPDKGSYLEKFGFWLGFLMEKAPITAVSLIGKVGNFRSDAIKDLSHGIIRKQDWSYVTNFFQTDREFYFGELDGEDFYQAYGVFSLPHNSTLSWMGDGIVEIHSLRYLNSKTVYKKNDSEDRILEIHGKNHFTMLNSGKLFRWLDRLFPIR